MIVLAGGYWCTNCEFFEDDAPGSSCPACGCAESDHVAANVVTP